MASRLRALWDHPAGIKTIFFWAPTMKWGLVFASISDINRPVEKLSVAQSSALALTGMVWTGANVFVALTNLYQLSRIAQARMNKAEAEPIPTTTSVDSTNTTPQN